MMFHDFCRVKSRFSLILSAVCRLFTNVKPWTAGHCSVSLTPRLHGPKLFETYSKPYTLVCYHCWWKTSCMSWQGSLCHDLHGILLHPIWCRISSTNNMFSWEDSDTPRKNSAFLLTSTPQNVAQTRALRPPSQSHDAILRCSKAIVSICGV